MFFKSSSKKPTAPVTRPKTGTCTTDYIEFVLPKPDMGMQMRFGEVERAFYESKKITLKELYRIYDTNYYILHGPVVSSYGGWCSVVLYKKDDIMYIPIMDSSSLSCTSFIDTLKSMGYKQNPKEFFKEHYRHESDAYTYKIYYVPIDKRSKSVYDTFDDFLSAIKIDDIKKRNMIPDIHLPFLAPPSKTLCELLEYDPNPKINPKCIVEDHYSNLYILEYRYSFSSKTITTYDLSSYKYEDYNNFKYALLRKKGSELYHVAANADIEKEFDSSYKENRIVNMKDFFAKHGNVIKGGEIYPDLKSAREAAKITAGRAQKTLNAEYNNSVKVATRRPQRPQK